MFYFRYVSAIVQLLLGVDLTFWPASLSILEIDNVSKDRNRCPIFHFDGERERLQWGTVAWELLTNSPALLFPVENWMVRCRRVQAIVRRPIAPYKSTGEMPSITAPITIGHRAILCTRPRLSARTHAPTSFLVVILQVKGVPHLEDRLFMLQTFCKISDAGEE